MALGLVVSNSGRLAATAGAGTDTRARSRADFNLKEQQKREAPLIYCNASWTLASLDCLMKMVLDDAHRILVTFCTFPPVVVCPPAHIVEVFVQGPDGIGGTMCLLPLWARC